MSKQTLYERLGGYDAIATVANDLLTRLQQDQQLSRFWKHRGDDGVNRERQLLIDFLCSSAGGTAVLHRSRYEDFSCGYENQRKRLVRISRTRK